MLQLIGQGMTSFISKPGSQKNKMLTLSTKTSGGVLLQSNINTKDDLDLFLDRKLLIAQRLSKLGIVLPLKDQFTTDSPLHLFTSEA